MREKVSFFSHLAVCVIAALLLAYLSFRYLLPVLLPFMLAWGLALIARPLARRIAVGRAERALRVVLSLLILILGVGAIVFLFWKLLSEAAGFLSVLVESGELDRVLARVLHPFGGEGASAAGARIGAAIASIASSLLSGIGGAVAAFASKIPQRVFFSVVLLIATVYFSLDLERVDRFLLSLLPRGARRVVLRGKERSLRVALRYIRSYALLMLITFSVLLAGLLLLRVRYALLVAALIALLDALPVIGVGTVLVPWSLYAFLTANASLGIGLLVLLAVNEILRQFLEPKILGKSLGIHPLLTLFLLYAGYSFFGIAGVFFVPLCSILLDLFLRRRVLATTGGDGADRAGDPSGRKSSSGADFSAFPRAGTDRP